MVKMKSRNELSRNISFIAMGFMVLFSVATLRAYFLQVLKSGELTELIQQSPSCGGNSAGPSQVLA